MSLATMVGPFGSTGPEAMGWAVAEEQAALIAARATRPRARRMRFMSGQAPYREGWCGSWTGDGTMRKGTAGPGASGSRGSEGSGARLAGRRPAAELRREESELALDDGERV